MPSAWRSKISAKHSGTATDRCSYALSRDSCAFFWFDFGVLKDGERSIFAGLRTRQGRSTRVRESSYKVTPSRSKMRPGTAGESFEGQQVRGSRLWGQAVPGVCGSAGSRAQVGVDLTGGVTLQAADDLCLGLSFFRAPLDVGAGGRVRSHPGEHDSPQGVVGLAVAAGVEPVAGDFPRGCGNRGSRAQVRPGGLGAESSGMVPGGDEQQRGGVGTDPVQGQKARGAGGDQGDDELVQALE